MPTCIVVAATLMAAILLVNPPRALAGECGDHVGGVRVPCACGDTVVSDTVLASSDPIFSARCPRDGLVLRADDLAESITLNLDGLAIVGTGAGTGIRVDSGGSDGAMIIGGRGGRRGEIVAFNVGILASEGRSVRRIESVHLEGNRREGLDLHTAGAVLIGVSAVRNGSDGLRVIGRGGRVVNVEAVENGGAGLRVYGFDMILAARAIGNARHGIVAGGYRNDLRGSFAAGNRGYGALLAGRSHLTEGFDASGNSLASIGYRNGGSPK